MEQKLHTPEGVRDIYNVECKKKVAVERSLMNIFHSYGYQDIQTPSIEYSDVFSKEIGTISSRELYKFFDRDGDTLVLRPDITPSIARAVATLFDSVDVPVRLCYSGNTFINHNSYQGRLKENTQLGSELIGNDSVEADAEMLAMVIDGLKAVGLTEFQVTIGHIDFLQSLLDAAGLDQRTEDEVQSFIANRNFFGVIEILIQNNVSEDIINDFQILPELTGDISILPKAFETARSDAAKQSVLRLQKIYEVLCLYQVEKYITFDLSMCCSYEYYSGIIFRAYTYGTGDAVVRGGRYDNLLGKFGKDTPSIGFAIIVDELMSALARQKIDIPVVHNNLIIYTDNTMYLAIELARYFRDLHKCIELLKVDSGKTEEDYISYGRRSGALSVMILQPDEKVRVTDLTTDETYIVGIEELK